MVAVAVIFVFVPFTVFDSGVVPPTAFRTGAPGASGASESIRIALAPAMLFAPLGTVVEFMTLPEASCTLPMVKLVTVRSLVACDAPTV